MNYLLKVYNAHFKKQLSRDDVVWTYSGVRPLCDDESDSPQAITRDYTLDIHDVDGQAPLLSVFGGKLTTYRKLAEHALENWRRTTKALARHGPKARYCGGDIGDNRDDYAAKLRRRYPFITEGMARHYARTYGSNTELILSDAKEIADWANILVTSCTKPNCVIWWNMSGFAVWMMPSGVVPKRVCG